MSWEEQESDWADLDSGRIDVPERGEGPLIDITDRVRAFAEAHPDLHPDNQPEPGRCTVRSFGPLVCATWDPPLAGTIRRSWSWDWVWWR